MYCIYEEIQRTALYVEAQTEGIYTGNAPNTLLTFAFPRIVENLGKEPAIHKLPLNTFSLCFVVCT